MFLNNSDAKFYGQDNEMRFRILHLMNYDVSQTNSENLIQEQISLMGTGIERAITGNVTKATTDWVSSWDKHDWASFVEITSGILGLIPSPASPFLLGISLGAGLYDAKMYFEEGDPYMGGLMMALAVLPAAEFVKAVPGSKKWLSKGTKYVEELLKKSKYYSKLEKLTSGQKQVVKDAGEFIKSTSKNANELAQAVSKKILGKTITEILATGGKIAWGLALLLSKASWAIGKLILKLGGTYYTYDEIYLALYGSDEQKMKLRYNSKFQQLVRALKILTKLESVESQMKEFVEMNRGAIESDPDKLAQVDPTAKYYVIENSTSTTTDKLIENQKKQLIAPSFQEILSGTIDPQTNKPYVMKKGQRGNSVKKLQNILVELGFREGLIGFKEEGNPTDSIFGDNTFDTIYYIQDENGINPTGIVDKTTLSKILKLQKSKNEKK